MKYRLTFRLEAKPIGVDRWMEVSERSTVADLNPHLELDAFRASVERAALDAGLLSVLDISERRD